jgi:hypothetical protein
MQAPAAPPPTLPAHAVGGFGMTQVRERLATLYGPQASAVLACATDAEGGTVATLLLPLAGPAAAAAPANS